MRGPWDLTAADGHHPGDGIYLLYIPHLLYKTSCLYQINHTIMVSMPGISSLGHLSPENSLEQIHIATVNVYVRHQGRIPPEALSEPLCTIY